MSAYTTASYTNNAPITGIRYATIINPPNPQLRWERTNVTNIGIDFSTSNQILSGSIEYFRRNGADIIGNATLPPSTGVTSLKGNFAKTQGNGIDIILNSKNLNGKLGWQTGFLFSYATDKVTFYDVVTSPQDLVRYGADVVSIYPSVDHPVYGLYSYRWAGLDPLNGDPIGFENGAKSKNYTNLINPANLGDVVYSGPAKPVFSGGLQNTISYQQFTLSVQLNYKLGYYFRPSSILYNSLFANGLGYADFTKRWQHAGDEATTHVPSLPPLTVNASNRDTFYNQSEILVQRGDHIRIQDINLTYSFPKPTLKQLGIGTLNLIFYARNLGILWRANKQKLDPDYFRTGEYPVPTNYSLALKATF